MKVLNYDSEKMFDYENGFYLTCDNLRMPKVLAQYELYKKILDLPGSIVECGVFKGASLIRFAHLREALENPDARKIIGFDSFGAFPRSELNEDNQFAEKHDSFTGVGIDKEDLEMVLAHKKMQNIELVAGDLNVTLPAYVETHPALKVALLHIDVDVYTPTKTALEVLYSRVVKGGVIVFDDYAHIAGETRAADEFFADKNLPIKKFPFSHSACYMIKD